MGEERKEKNKYPMNGVIEYDYNYTPKTTIVINYFTSLETMIRTIDNLRTLGDEVEIIVNNDNYGKDVEKIMQTLNRRNDRMAVSRDIGERRGYDNGARMSISSDFLIFTQDDDLAPNNNQWYEQCLSEFKNDSKLGMIGMLKGGWNYWQQGYTTITNKYYKSYVSWLATGPLMIRRDLYFEINGWSEEYSQVGEADGGADADLTTKVMLAGYKSMLLRSPEVRQWQRRFKRGDGKPNGNDKKIRTTTTWGKNCNARILLNNKIYAKKYKGSQPEIYKEVKQYNEEIGIKL